MALQAKLNATEIKSSAPADPKSPAQKHSLFFRQLDNLCTKIYNLESMNGVCQAVPSARRKSTKKAAKNVQPLQHISDQLRYTQGFNEAHLTQPSPEPFLKTLPGFFVGQVINLPEELQLKR